MEVYFLRHGEAEIAIFDTPEADYERNLTVEGQKMMLMEAVGLKKMVKSFDLILTSHLVRAYQTAVIFGEVFNCTDRITETDSLEEPWSVEGLMELLAINRHCRRVLCIGQEPGLGILTTEIVTGIGEENFFPFERGSLLRMDLDRPHPAEDARLIYFLPPGVLMSMGQTIEEDTFEHLDNEEAEDGRYFHEEDQEYPEPVPEESVYAEMRAKIDREFSQGNAPKGGSRRANYTDEDFGSGPDEEPSGGLNIEI